jgi:hypothetical protein
MVFLDARVFARPEVMIGPASDKFDANGGLVDAPTRDAIRTQLVEFAGFVRERPAQAA